MYQRGILIMISYEIGIGFAIGRLISVFHEMAARLTGDPRRVHFSFGKVAGERSAALPADFTNVLEFNYRKHDAADLERFTAYLREHDIGLIFGLDLPVSAACLKHARRAGVRTVVSYLGAPMSSLNHGLKLLIKRLEVAWRHRAKPDHFIFESQAMRHYGVHGRGIDARATSIVHTGVDLRKFSPAPGDRGALRARFEIPPDRKIVVNMGHLHRRKGVHVLMAAMEHLVGVSGRRDIHCVFLGNRAGEAEQFAGILDAALPYVTFGGYQSDIPALLNGADVGCIPSTGWDSFPMSSLEMQACGLPVIVSDLQGTPETIVDGETGIVTPAGDAVRLAETIAALVDDRERLARMRTAARARIEAGFSREHSVDALSECVGRLAHR
jgi:glycosyltransferase involved in cell wall biosynthesis